MKLTHRPQSVQPDLDDVLLRPNMARAAENLRFSAGEDDTNLGITAVRGNRALTPQSEVPELCVGQFVSEEDGHIYYAIWRADGSHRILRVNRKNDLVETVIRGSGFLNFQANSFVNISVIDGKIYISHEGIQPLKFEIDKAINTWGSGTGSDSYSSTPPLWQRTRIKRQPAFAPRVVAENTGIIEQDINPRAPKQGFQFAYYYEYDGNENSRLSPYSEPIFTTKGVRVFIPESESSYFVVPTIITKIVVCYRLGNIGTWYILKKIDAQENASVVIPDMRLAPRNVVSGELLTDQEDSVPLRSRWQTIIENRIIDVDYDAGYPAPEGITLEASFNPVSLTTFNSTFKPGEELYNVGVEILDEFGRRSGIVAQQTVSTLDWKRWYLYMYGNGFDANNFVEPFQVFDISNPYFRQDPAQNGLTLTATVSGQMPDWGKYLRVMVSRNQTTTTFYRTQAKMLFWYTDSGQDFFVLNSTPTTQGGLVLQFEADGTKKYEGIVIFLAQDEPFLVDSSKINYVNLIGAAHFGILSLFPNRVIPYTQEQFESIAKKYVIVKQEENKLFIRLTDQEKLDWFQTNYVEYIFTGGSTVFNSYTTSLDIELSIQSDTPDTFYYQSSAIAEIQRNQTQYTFTLNGDCYVTPFKKTYRGVSTPPARTLLINNHDPISRGVTTNWSVGAFDIYGTYFAMNPTNIYNQNWDIWQGQFNIVREDEGNLTFPNNLLVSNPLQVGTKVNGLSQVSALDQPEPFSLELGRLTGIISTTGISTEPGVVLAIGENAVQSVYLRAEEIQTGGGQGILTVASTLFGSRRLLQGRMGTSIRKSIQRAPTNYVYWYSDKVEDIVRYSGEGLQALGTTHGFGNQLAIEIGSGPATIAYDEYYGEIMAIHNSKAYVYSEKYKSYQGVRIYPATPEFGASLYDKFYSVLNGTLYVSDRNLSDMGRFYGLTPDIKLTIVPNANYVITKLWEHIEIYGEQPDVIRLYTKDGNQTTIFPNEIELIKDRVYGAFRADESSIGGKYNGSLIESNLCYIEIIWKVANFVKLNQIIVGAVPAVMQ